jgi:hypothetical protein
MMNEALIPWVYVPLALGAAVLLVLLQRLVEGGFDGE